MCNYFRSDTLIIELKRIGHIYRVSFSHLLPTCAHNLRPQMRPEQSRAEQSRSSAKRILQSSPAADSHLPITCKCQYGSVCVCECVCIVYSGLYATVRSALINESRRVLRVYADKAILLNICVICPEWVRWRMSRVVGGKSTAKHTSSKHWNRKGRLATDVVFVVVALAVSAHTSTAWSLPLPLPLPLPD